MLLEQSYKVDELGTMSEGAVNIPDGEYHAIIDNLVGKPTKDGQGQFAELTVRITQGEFQGTVFIDRLNVINQNQDAVRIAFQALADICRSLGLTETPTDLTTLVGKPLIIKSKKKTGKDWVDPQTGETVKGTERSEIAKYKPATGGQSAPAQAAAPQPQAQTQPAQAAASQPAQVNAPAENPFAT